MIAALAVAGTLAIAAVAWRRLRLRRALFLLRQQLAWSYRAAPRRHLVLDVGAGNNPHLRADVLCERLLSDDVHRGGAVTRDRPLVAGDAAALPFKSGAFDQIIARAVIEHLPDPPAFFAEAGRVARAGLFVAPSAAWERCYSLATHLWTVEQANGRLRLTAKPRAVLDPDTQRFFAEQVFRDAAGTDDFLLDHWPALRVTYEWRGRPECEIQGTPGGRAEGFVRESPDTAPVHHRPTGLERLRARLKQRVRRALHAVLSAHRRVDWTDILACPACHADVRITATEVQCSTCHRRYPITDGVPIMLLEAATVDEGGAGLVAGPLTSHASPACVDRPSGASSVAEE